MEKNNLFHCTNNNSLIPHCKRNCLDMLCILMIAKSLTSVSMHTVVTFPFDNSNSEAKYQVTKMCLQIRSIIIQPYRSLRIQCLCRYKKKGSLENGKARIEGSFISFFSFAYMTSNRNYQAKHSQFLQATSDLARDQKRYENLSFSRWSDIASVLGAKSKSKNTSEFSCYCVSEVKFSTE